MENSDVPEYLNYLRDGDKYEYIELRKMFTSEDYDFFKENPFNEILSIIKDFSIRNNDDDARRMAVCGLCWLNSCLGVNQSHLTYLTGQPKLTLNTGFNKLNYQLTQFSDEIIIKIPYLKGNISELRLWTFRKNPSNGGVLPNINYRNNKSFSPKPKLNRESIFDKPWSYEDYAFITINCVQTTMSADDFYNDDYLIAFREPVV